MSKIPDCDRCLLFSQQLYYVCAVHPEGVEGDECPDFRPDPEIDEEEEEKPWSPAGHFWYGDNLLPDRLWRPSKEEQEKIIETHPLFTGLCPNCSHVFSTNPPTGAPWHCPACDWREDSPIYNRTE
ncbi:hypothetical protein V0288_23110 [Pannus brasiliensis CCIBt3594]|uniref:Cysteine-rich CPCC domain-containing protein n=1 Tax=Pannus brasiliensis CCIBt3594 TaxID=1427578 RepID=A0AAW9QZ42_9CHRO